MITCAKCSKENQDHYKFCLGCGAELPRGNAPKPFSPQTPPHGVPAARPSGAPTAAAQAVPAAAGGSAPPAAAAGGGLGSKPAPAPVAAASPSAAPAGGVPRPSAAPVAQAPRAASAPAPAAASPSAPAPATGGVTCPQCGHGNSQTNRFCASCGYNLGALQAAAAPAAAPAAATGAPAAGQVGAIQLTALRADGSEAGTYRVPDTAQVAIGRDTGSIFAGDSYLSPRHATLQRREGKLFIQDESSLNGVYLKLKPHEPWPLVFDDVFRIGQEIIRYEELKMQGKSPDGVERFGSPAKGYIGRLSLMIGRDTTGNSFPIPERGVHCGRERGDILFSEDGYVSGLHCRVGKQADGAVALTDVGSSNGTFIRIRDEQPLKPGDILLMGQQLFRVDF